ncbi:hypothetical protein [Halobacillus litoralis]|uniref:hypothetical protein n=1 Tax=Halobacillus litoralis TaxID=45668 RepID=UPI001CD50028|nr:hypothetical protein [Halobacillus litoralis]MCA1021575.1 hypothetical protein [Halobacillus litoralis]
MNYTQEEVDRIHDTLIDLIVSCMRTGEIKRCKPKVGDWCIETSSFRVDNDNCIGKLLHKDGDSYKIQTVGGKEVNWRNATFSKIPDRYLRIK